MKKLLLLFLGACIILMASKCQTDPPVQSHKIRYSLNGIPYDSAYHYVERFLKHKQVNDSTTSVLYSYSAVHGMDSLLEADDADGFRIYYGKDKFYHSNIVIVPTFSAGESHVNRCKFMHADFFILAQGYFEIKPSMMVGDVSNMIIPGASLYDSGFHCPNIMKEKHNIPCDTALAMILRYKHLTKKDTINTTSEWFDVGLIHDINSALTARGKTGGLRIYFGRDTTKRDNFVLITTQKKNGVQTDNVEGIKHNKARYRYALSGSDTSDVNDNGEKCLPNCDVSNL